MNAKLSITKHPNGTTKTIVITFRPTDSDGREVIDGRMLTVAFDADRADTTKWQEGWEYTEYPTYSPAVGIHGIHDAAEYTSLEYLADALNLIK